MLLDQTPANENLLVRVVRPEEEIEKVLEESRKQLALTATRRRRKGKSGNGTNRVITRNGVTPSTSISEEEHLKNLPTESKNDDVS